MAYKWLRYWVAEDGVCPRRTVNVNYLKGFIGRCVSPSRDYGFSVLII
jgi:hypothetical protein